MDSADAILSWASRTFEECQGVSVSDMTGDQARGCLIHLVHSDGAPTSVIVRYFFDAPRDEVNRELRDTWDWDVNILVEAGRIPAQLKDMYTGDECLDDCVHGGPDNCKGCMD